MFTAFFMQKNISITIDKKNKCLYNNIDAIKGENKKHTVFLLEGGENAVFLVLEETI